MPSSSSKSVVVSMHPRSPCRPARDAVTVSGTSGATCSTVGRHHLRGHVEVDQRGGVDQHPGGPGLQHARPPWRPPTRSPAP